MIPLANFDALLILGGAMAAALAFLGMVGLVWWAISARKDRRLQRAAKREEMRRVRSPLFEVPSGQTQVDGRKAA